MTEFKKPEPPKPWETKYVVPAEEFIKAVKGESFTAKGLYRLNSREAEKLQLVSSYYFGPEKRYYVILDNAIISDTEMIDLFNAEITDYKTGFIFYNSILPGIRTQNIIMSDWELFNSLIKENISVSDNSQIGNLNVYDNSQIKNIWVSNKSRIGNINITSNSKIGSIYISNNSQIESIGINSKSERGNIYIKDNSQSGNIWVSNDSKSGYIWVGENSQIGNISINNNSQSGYVNINNNSESGYIWVSENSQIRNIDINSSQIRFISVNDNSQIGNISVDSNSQIGNIYIKDNSQSENIRITENSYTGCVEISNSSCNQLIINDNHFSIRLFNASIPLMNISNSRIIELTWQAGTRGELYISDSKINHLNLQHTSLLKDALISITNSELFIAQMNKLTVQGQLILTKLKNLESPFSWEPPLLKILGDEKRGDDASGLAKRINQIKTERLIRLEEQYNEGNEKLLKEISAKPLWQMANSSFGKTEITGCDLTGFVFEYRDSKLLDTFISGTKLSKDKIDIYNANPETPLDNVDFFEQKISIYSQLKKIFENQGNIVEATWYHSKAMDNQQRLLQLNLRRQKKGWFSEEEFEFFNFKLNKLSNNHGESWRKALWFVLISSLIVYSLYYTSINYHKEFSFKGIGNFIGRFFSFLNFTRREDFMAEKEELNAFSYFFDYLGRVVTGFGIYQLIAAFRRHGRK